MAHKTQKKAGFGHFTHITSLGGIHEYELKKNGLRVLFLRKPGTQAVVSNIVYLVGSRHETRGKTGIAHMLEHMLFKDTVDKEGNRSPKPRHISLQNKGALLNASTWLDRTNYYFVMPPEYLDEMLSAEAERMRGLILTQKEYLPEQQNVLSEFEMYASRPDHVLESALNNHAFVSHGYGHDTIGFKSDIESLTCEDLRAFYDTYYWPNNAYLILVGDVEQEYALSLVAEHFSHITRSPHQIPQTTTEEPPRTGSQTLTILKNSPLTLTSLCYPTPCASDPSWPALHILISYLTSGKLSPLYKKLVETHKASSVGASYMPLHDPGTLTIQASVSQNTKPKEIHNCIFSEIEHIGMHGITKKDIARVQEKLIADILYAKDGTYTVAQELVEYVAGGNWKLYVEITQQLREVTPSEVQECAQRWLRKETVLIGTLGKEKAV